MLSKGGSLPKRGSGRLSLKQNGLEEWVKTIEDAMREAGDGVFDLAVAKAAHAEAKSIIDNEGALIPGGLKITKHKLYDERFVAFRAAYEQLGATIERAEKRSARSAPSSGPSTGVPAPAPLSRPSSAPAEAVGVPSFHAGSDDGPSLPRALAQPDAEPQPLEEVDAAPPVHRPAPPSGSPSPRAEGDGVLATSFDDDEPENDEPDADAAERQKRALRLGSAIDACRQQLQKLGAKQAQQLKTESEECFNTLLRGGDPETQMRALRQLHACYEPLKNKHRTLYQSVVNVIALVVEALLVATAAFGIGLAISAWAGPMAIAIGIAAAIAALALATTAEYGRCHLNRFGLFKDPTPYDVALDALEVELAPAAAAPLAS